MSESYGFIESSIIFNSRTLDDVKKHSFSDSDFSIHGAAYTFLLSYFDQYKSFPSGGILKEKFPDLDETSVGAELSYSIQVFKDQVLTRNATKLIRSYNSLIVDDPKKAVGEIIRGLDGLTTKQDDDILLYDGGSTNRLDEYRDRRSKRTSSRLKIIGIPTPLRTLNQTGVGMLPGEICSLFARAGVGKSWFAIKAAAICSHLGHKTLFITPEMTAEQMALRIDVMLAKIKGYEFSHRALKTGNDIDEEKYRKFLSSTKDNRFLICDNIGRKSISLSGISSLIRKHKPEVLVIDNMELLSPTERAEKLYEKMHNLYYGLKTICTSNKICAFVTHQATRSAAANPYRFPRVDEVSSGDALIRASDIALAMCLVKDDDHKRMIGFQKFRDIERIDREYVIIQFDVDKGIFSEAS